MRTRDVPQSEAPVYSRQQATYVAPRRRHSTILAAHQQQPAAHAR